MGLGSSELGGMVEIMLHEVSPYLAGFPGLVVMMGEQSPSSRRLTLNGQVLFKSPNIPLAKAGQLWIQKVQKQTVPPHGGNKKASW